jgi:hypothetical protein
MEERTMSVDVRRRRRGSERKDVELLETLLNTMTCTME